MSNIILVLIVLPIFLLIDPLTTSAEQVSKNSVILNKVRDVKNAQGVVYAEESIYVGGIGGNRSALKDSNSTESDTMLIELRPPMGTFIFSRSGVSIKFKVVPMVANQSQSGRWSPASGNWDFSFGETNSYESVIHVQNGGDLSIAYQSTGMKIGEKAKVLHYGLTGNPHAINLSRKRLKAAFPTKESSARIKPILNYQPSSDMILVQLKLTSEGLSLEPIFDYEVVKN